LANDPTCLLVNDSGLPGEEAIFELLAELHDEGLTIVVASPNLGHYLSGMRAVRVDQGSVEEIPASIAAGEP
jgi:hypothetical protein